MSDLRIVLKTIVEPKGHQSRALALLVDRLCATSPDIASSLADLLITTDQHGDLIEEGKVYVVGHWSADGSGFRWFRDKEAARKAWEQEKSIADATGESYYAVWFISEARSLDIPHRVTDDVGRYFENHLDDDDTILYHNKVLRRGNSEITQEEEKKFCG